MWYEFNKENTKVIIKHPKIIGVRFIRNEEVPEMLRYPNENSNLILTKTDKNGTKYYKTDICPICNGWGKVYFGSSDNNDFLCNKCTGFGKLEKAKTYKIHTHEYGLILEQEYMKKKNKKFFDKNGINEDGSTYVYIGNTYSIKEELKSKGAKFNDTLYKWCSKDLIESYPYIRVIMPLKTYSDGSIGYDYGYAENESHFSESTRLNHLLDDVKEQIKVAEEELKSAKGV